MSGYVITDQEVRILEEWDQEDPEDYDIAYHTCDECIQLIQKALDEKGYQWVDDKDHLAEIIISNAFQFPGSSDDNKLWILMKDFLDPRRTQMTKIFRKHYKWIMRLLKYPLEEGDLSECYDQEIKQIAEQYYNDHGKNN